MKTIGIALSGGGARGFAHLGVVKALHEKGIYPEIFSGTSAGAFAGAFLANGVDPDEIFKFFKGHKIFDVGRLKMPRNGLLNMQKIKEEIRERIGISDLKETQYPFYACVSNMTKGKVEYFNKGPAVDLLIASASIPVLFSPVKIRQDLYSDGGVFDNLPIRPIRNKCDFLIGVHVNPVKEMPEISGIIEMASRAFNLSVNNSVGLHRKECDLWIEPDNLDKYEVLEFSEAENIFKAGYDHTKGMSIDI